MATTRGTTLPGIIIATTRSTTLPGIIIATTRGTIPGIIIITMEAIARVIMAHIR
jgi:hypothetical protein